MYLSLSSSDHQEQEQQRYFGSPLEKVVEADGVPRFIKQCTQIIETDGLKIEGIYRVSGKKDACLDLQDQYDMGTLRILCIYQDTCHMRSF